MGGAATLPAPPVAFGPTLPPPAFGPAAGGAQGPPPPSTTTLAPPACRPGTCHGDTGVEPIKPPAWIGNPSTDQAADVKLLKQKVRRLEELLNGTLIKH